MQNNSAIKRGVILTGTNEYLEFRFRLVNTMMLIGAFFTAMFVVLEWLGLNSLGPKQLLATGANCIVTLVLWFTLHGHRERYTGVAATLIAVHFLTYMSALLFVEQDELRVLWFYILLACTYILLGKGAGVVLTGLSLAGISIANHFLLKPFSANAITTLTVSLLVTSFVFYAYTTRAYSFFERMTATNLQLQELVSKDPLTSMLNSRAFREVTNHLMQLDRRSRLPSCMLFLDLDHFKVINDHHGHETGDDVLIAVANCLSQSVRQSDVIGRVGGEEFVVYLPGTTLSGAMSLGESIRRSLEQLEITVRTGQKLRITASIGVTELVAADLSVVDAQSRADSAMYQAKAMGRNRVLAAA